MAVPPSPLSPSSPHSPRPGLRLALLAFTQFLLALDYNIVYVALPGISEGLGFTAQSLQWVVSGYAIGFGGFLLLGGRAVDRLGQRRMFMLGLAVFAAACVLGGLATGPWALVAARAAQGFGAALVSPATLSLVNTGFAEGPQRVRALSVWAAGGSAGLAAGALLGGVLTEYGGWRWVLFVMAPPALLALLAAPRLLDADPGRASARGGFDLPGTAIATSGSVLLVFGLVSGPEAGWLSWRGLGASAIGLALLALFVLVERRTRDPLVPLRLFANRSLATALLVILVFQSALGGAYYIFTTYLQGGLHYDPLRAGLAFLPVTVLSLVAGLKIGPALLGRWGIRRTLVTGMVLNGLGIAALAAGMSADGSFWAELPGIVVWGIGGGMTFPAMFVAASSGVDAAEAGIASALATTSQQIGGAVGLAVLIAVAGLGTGASGAADPADLVAGLRTAGLVAGAAAVAGAGLGLALKRPDARTVGEPVPAPARELVDQATSEGS
ncbi:MFS transporter [Streptomyces netropsis]|uniref:EmrB/QacA subfamily drug resistance transporter n=1 Tax=Streptomyces netropsis TaxID=55404 RepID=A0A7W7PD09_STRNE|nr:MFS transporter [Streptomyces netropsis]MBB4886266.1 EmrB/QacA subfamily drug resistance transporter [Streptomyces netropsis]GGR15243.1 MFS transporter [Streptomyces netropsis]